MEDLSLHVLDIAENATRAKAGRIEIIMHEDETVHLLNVMIRDNGKGMPQEDAQKASNAFFTTKAKKKFGLGLPLLRQSAEETGGLLEIRSTPGKGTEVIALFHTDHPDMRPVGDLLETVATLVTANPEIQFVADIHTRDYRFHFDSLTGLTKPL